jgi:hypothetical protein
MPLMCQCAANCGYDLCCRLASRRRKQAGDFEDKCDPCRGGTGRDRQLRKRPAAAIASANVPGAEPSAALLPVLERIATALEQLSPRPGQLQHGPPAEQEQEQEQEQEHVPASLQPLLAAALAAEGQPNAAQAVALSLGFPEGHPQRSLVFAALNAVLAVSAPQASLSGLSMARPGPSSRESLRLQRFCQEHASLCFQAATGQGALPTIVQSVSRGLRCERVLRQRHGKRFLKEVALLVSQGNA